MLLGSGAVAAGLTMSDEVPAAMAQPTGAMPTVATPSGAPVASWATSKNEEVARKLQPILSGTMPLDAPGLNDEVERSFWTTASMITRVGAYPTVDIFAYDPVTRCALLGTVDVSQKDVAPTFDRYVRLADASQKDTVPSVAIDSGRAMAAFMNHVDAVPANGCAAEIEAAYSSISTERSRISKLAEHSTSVLRGGPAGTAEAPLDHDAARQTAISRERASPLMNNPQVLGVIVTAEHTIVLTGEPRRPVRWASQYKNIAPGRWQFEGASDVGLSLL